MKTFNKYQFLRDLEEAINEDLAYCYSKNMDIEEDQVHEFIHTHIENHTIYSNDAWAIAYELGENDFENPITGETCKNIYELAFYSLLDYVQSEIDVTEILESFNTQNA